MRPKTRRLQPSPGIYIPFQRDRPSSMSIIFSIFRLGLYCTVLLWTLICLAVAVHLHGSLDSSDLTRFVPFSIFVCSASLLIFLALLLFGLRKDRNPISTRIELACLGLAGTLWLALGAFLATSPSQDADVECFVDSSQTPMTNPPFTTGAFQAQYRVLEAFSLFNVTLIWGFALLLLCLGLRQHFQGKNEAWGYPVTTYPWFQPGGKLKPAGLPSPVTQRDRRGTQPLSPYTVEDRRRNFQERGRTGRPENSHVRGKSSTSQKDGVKGRAKEYKARRDRDGMTPIYDKYYRSASPRR